MEKIEVKTEVMDKELVLIPESRLKNFGTDVNDWERYEGDERYDIYFSPSSVEFDSDDLDEYLPTPEVWYLLYDKIRKEVIHLGGNLEGFGEGMSQWYDDKLWSEEECIINFTKYIIEKYGRKETN
ncbi:MAG: hypothetical protein ACLQUS_10120 [Desulfobaccales bacterium]